MTDNRFDYAYTVWSNCTLGLLSYWWHSSLQQSGRGIITIRSAETLPVLDFRALSDAQLATAEGIFDEFRELELLPVYLADADPSRALLDRRVVCACWASTRMCTGACGVWRPSGAPSRPYTAARPGPRARST